MKCSRICVTRVNHQLIFSIWAPKSLPLRGNITPWLLRKEVSHCLHRELFEEQLTLPITELCITQKNKKRELVGPFVDFMINSTVGEIKLERPGVFFCTVLNWKTNSLGCLVGACGFFVVVVVLLDFLLGFVVVVGGCLFVCLGRVVWVFWLIPF